MRIGNAFGYHMDIIALPTGLTMTLSDGESNASSIVRVSERTTDLLKLEQVNDIAPSGGARHDARGSGPPA